MELTQAQKDNIDQRIWLAMLGLAKAERDAAMVIWENTFESEAKNVTRLK